MTAILLFGCPDVGLYKPYSKEGRRATGNDSQGFQDGGRKRQCCRPPQAGYGEWMYRRPVFLLLSSCQGPPDRVHMEQPRHRQGLQDRVRVGQPHEGPFETLKHSLRPHHSLFHANWIMGLLKFPNISFFGSSSAYRKSRDPEIKDTYKYMLLLFYYEYMLLILL